MHPEAAKKIAVWVDHFGVEIKITRSRSSVFGDYRHPHGGKGHRISINHDQNQYAFLITMVHEFAHLVCWNKYRNQIKPHGEEWKSEFKKMMTLFFDLNIFPAELIVALKKYLNNPFASGCSDVNLMNTLRLFDSNKQTVLVSSITQGSLFSLKNGRVFQKGHRIRKRFQCVDINSKQVYLFSPSAEVYLRDPEND